MVKKISSCFIFLQSHEKIFLYTTDEANLRERILFFQSHDDPILPSLRLLHTLQQLDNKRIILKSIEIDTGAIKHVLSGADIMCPGIQKNSPNTSDSIEVGDIVVMPLLFILLD